MIEIKTIPGMLSFKEAQRNLLNYARLIADHNPAEYYHKERFASSINIRLESIKAISDLIKEYMEQMIIIYQRFGKKYRKIDRDEVIKAGAMQSWHGGELSPIMNSDSKTIGNRPSNFSDEREFYNPLEEDKERGITEFLDNLLDSNSPEDDDCVV